MRASVKMGRGDKMKWSALESTVLRIGAVTAVFYQSWGSGAGDSYLSLMGNTPCFTDFDPVAVTTLHMWPSGSCCVCTDRVAAFSTVSEGHASQSLAPRITEKHPIRSAKSLLCC